EIDDVRGEPQLRRDLHRAIELDAFGLDALRLEPAARRRGIFGRDTDMTFTKPRRRAALGPRERQAAMTDAEVDGGVKLRIVELVDDVRPDDAELRRAMRDESRDIEGAHADQRDMRLVCPKN